MKKSPAAYANCSIMFFKSVRRNPYILKAAVDRRHHCLTPNVVLNHSPLLQSTEIHNGANQVILPVVELGVSSTSGFL